MRRAWSIADADLNMALRCLSWNTSEKCSDGEALPAQSIDRCPLPVARGRVGYDQWSLARTVCSSDQQTDYAGSGRLGGARSTSCRLLIQLAERIQLLRVFLKLHRVSLRQLSK